MSFLPSEYPTIPSVEKAYASRIKADKKIRLIKIVLAATTSSLIALPKQVKKRKEKVKRTVLIKILKLILNMEILEHVDDINFFIKKSSNLLKKNGLMFVATLNKTFKSYLFAIIGAEYILKWLPIGTHDWEKFVKPDELVNLGKKFNLKLKKLNGMEFNPIMDKWYLSNDKSVNYIGKFKKI